MSEQELLLRIRDLKIEGRSDETWTQIVNGIDLDLHKGEVLGLIGESGAGKSTIGLAAMGFTRDGCRISNGSVEFDGIDLVNADAATKRVDCLESVLPMSRNLPRQVSTLLTG